MLKEMVPIELLRFLLGVIGLGAAFMAGRTMAAVRKGRVKPGRQFAWIVRAGLCLGALAFRQRLDSFLLGAWVLAAVAFAVGWWQAAHQKPPEDLSQDIVPHDT